MTYVAKYREQAYKIQAQMKESDEMLYPVMEIIKALINYQGDETQVKEWLRNGQWRRGKI